MTWAYTARSDGLPALKARHTAAVSYSNHSGLEGGVSLKNVVVTLPNLPPLRTALTSANLFPDRIHVEPAVIQSSSGGSLQAGGDYYFFSQRLVAALSTDGFSWAALKNPPEAWFGEPPAFAGVHDGTITGRLIYASEPQAASSWSGQFQFADASIGAPALALPLEHSRGRVTFDSSTLNVDRFSATWGEHAVFATYHYNAAAKRPEHLHIEIPGADLAELESALDPTLHAQSLLARLRLTRRSIPPWLAERNLDGDLAIARFAVNGADLGPLSARFTWRGANLNF